MKKPALVSLLLVGIAATVLAADVYKYNPHTGKLDNTGPFGGAGVATIQQQSTEYPCTRKLEVKDSAGAITYFVQANGMTVMGAPMSGFPNISSVSPANGATGVARNTTIKAYFTRSMEATTITTSNATIDHGVTGSISYVDSELINANASKQDSYKATFTPFRNLTTNTTYSATVTTSVRDANCNAMQSNYTWSFTTTSTP